MNDNGFSKCPLCKEETLEYVAKADSFWCYTCKTWLEWDYVYNYREEERNE